MKLTTIHSFFLSVLLLIVSQAHAATLHPSKNLRASSTATRSLGSSGGYFACGSAWCVTNRSTCEEATSTCTCLSGYAGDLCEDQDECLSDPCPDNSICVDYDPPRRYKCQCQSSFEPVLPNAVTDPVPIEWRPVACLAKANEEENSPPGGTEDDAPTPAPIVPTLPPLADGACRDDSDCSGNNMVCDNNNADNSNTAGTCGCPDFYAQVGPNCQLEDFCAPGFPNDCHKNAICSNNSPSNPGYSCACSDGFQDKNPGVDKIGTICKQTQECLTGAEGALDCASQNKTCVDRVPPKKWECVEPTPAPSPAPTNAPPTPKSCSTKNLGADTGCQVSSGAYQSCYYSGEANLYPGCLATCEATKGCEVATGKATSRCYLYGPTVFDCPAKLSGSAPATLSKAVSEGSGVFTLSTYDGGADSGAYCQTICE